jgi:5-methyltetrahydrofolate--homocysteine methyltransferase
MARAYFEAGSDMVLTNSFAATRFMLDKYGLGHRVSEFNRLAAAHARSQAPAGC